MSTVICTAKHRIALKLSEFRFQTPSDQNSWITKPKDRSLCQWMECDGKRCVGLWGRIYQPRCAHRSSDTMPCISPSGVHAQLKTSRGPLGGRGEVTLHAKLFDLISHVPSSMLMPPRALAVLNHLRVGCSPLPACSVQVVVLVGKV